MRSRPTSSMKKGWLCRTSYDEIVYPWWWPVEIQIELWSRSSYDDSERSRSSNDPDPAVMIQIQSSDDDPYREMIQIRWWRWLEDEDDPVDTEKKTCRKNTFLVKRECWCICNFGMYFSMYIMYSNPTFISGCIVIADFTTPGESHFVWPSPISLQTP